MGEDLLQEDENAMEHFADEIERDFEEDENTVEDFPGEVKRDVTDQEAEDRVMNEFGYDNE